MSRLDLLEEVFLANTCSNKEKLAPTRKEGDVLGTPRPFCLLSPRQGQRANSAPILLPISAFPLGTKITPTRDGLGLFCSKTDGTDAVLTWRRRDCANSPRYEAVHLPEQSEAPNPGFFSAAGSQPASPCPFNSTTASSSLPQPWLHSSILLPRFSV